MIVYDAPQGSPEWHAARAGVTTASIFGTARARLKSGPCKGAPTSAAMDQAYRIAIERISGQPLDEGVETYWMRRGHELEQTALDLYEVETGRMVQRCGFVATDDRKFGASADGLVGTDGGVEVKCWIDASNLRRVIGDGDTADVRDQCLGGMWVTGRKWWDFVLYCPALASIGRALTVIRIDRDDDEIEAMERDLVEFDGMVEQYRAALAVR